MSNRVTLLRPETEENGLKDGIVHRDRGGGPPSSKVAANRAVQMGLQGDLTMS